MTRPGPCSAGGGATAGLERAEAAAALPAPSHSLSPGIPPQITLQFCDEWGFQIEIMIRFLHASDSV